jgi:hypothetical protein
MKGLVVITMNVGTWMFDLAGHDHICAWEPFGNLGIFGILEASMPASKRSFDCLGFCLNFANTRGARGTTRMLFSAKMILVRHQPMQVATNTHSVA